MSGNVPEKPPGGELLLYRTEDGRTRLECRFDEGTIWLSQALIAQLFQISIPNVNMHLRNIFAEGELGERATIKDYLIVRQEGARMVSRSLRHYRLEPRCRFRTGNSLSPKKSLGEASTLLQGLYRPMTRTGTIARIPRNIRYTLKTARKLSHPLRN